MRGRRAVGLPWRRGDRQEATPATPTGQERAARAFERTARWLPRDCAAVQTIVKQRGLQEREQPGAQKKFIPYFLYSNCGLCVPQPGHWL